MRRCIALAIVAVLASATWNTASAGGGPAHCLCCYDGACYPIPPADCPVEPTCSPETFGACCFTSTCGDSFGQDECEASGGTYLGDFTRCFPLSQCNLPDVAFPCCVGESCIMLLADDCIAMGGNPILIPDSECADVSCPGDPPPGAGACCNTPQGCWEDTTAEECADLGGDFLGAGSLCGPATCSPVEALECCCLDGGCIELGVAECAAAGGVDFIELGLSCTCAAHGVSLCNEPEVEHNQDAVRDTELPEETEPHSGYVDPRMESTNGLAVNLGVKSALIAFKAPVFGSPAGGPIGVSNFAITETGGASPPVLQSVERLSARRVRVTWDRPITLKQWTTVKANVYSAAGTAILDMGNLGPVNEPDRVDLGFLPGDIDQNGAVNPIDLLRFKQGVNGQWSPALDELMDYIDMDRNGVINPLDLLRFKQLINGNGTSTQAWSAVSMQNSRP